MREPDFDFDCWALDDGEERHRDAPETFRIPSLAARKGLQRGDYAKLIFRIAMEGEEVAVERMWAIVTERTADGYLGILDNDPTLIEENDVLWRGSELPFRARHVIDLLPATDASRTVAEKGPTIPWRG